MFKNSQMRFDKLIGALVQGTGRYVKFDVKRYKLDLQSIGLSPDSCVCP